jgi:DNA-binding XRE family transcriptional regulator
MLEAVDRSGELISLRRWMRLETGVEPLLLLLSLVSPSGRDVFCFSSAGGSHWSWPDSRETGNTDAAIVTCRCPWRVDFSLPTCRPSIKYGFGMVGEELRKARRAAGLTQEELSFRAGLHRTYISQLESNKKSPTLDVLFRICDALGVRASRVVAGVERRRARHLPRHPPKEQPHRSGDSL